MKITCGTDIIEIKRIQNAITKNKKFIYKIFTSSEIKYCESKKKSKYQHYAARFAAKEAVFKAISTALNNKYEISWKDIEIENCVNGKPLVKLVNKEFKKINNIELSISHCKEYATAMVIVVKE